MQHSSKDPDASKSSLFCSEIKAYVLIFDSDSPLSACYRTRGSWYPMFLYGTPFTDLGPTSDEDSRDQKLGVHVDSQWTIHQADELRIYAIPYSLWDQSHSNEPKLAAYPLLLALDPRLGVSFRHLWYDRVVSPPGYQPIRFGNDTSRIRYEFWFRSPVLEHWIRPYYPTNIRDSFIGFPHLRVEFQNDQGQNIGILIFDCRGSPADRWFTSKSLTYAWPWRTDDLRRYVFVQFGAMRNLPWSKHYVNEENNWSQVDLWIGKITQSRGNQSAIHTCTSFVLLTNTSAKHHRRLPSCLLGLEDVKQTKNRAFMGVSRNEAMASQMIQVHRVIVWAR